LAGLKKCAVTKTQECVTNTRAGIASLTRDGRVAGSSSSISKNSDFGNLDVAVMEPSGKFPAAL